MLINIVEKIGKFIEPHPDVFSELRVFQSGKALKRELEQRGVKTRIQYLGTQKASGWRANQIGITFETPEEWPDGTLRINTLESGVKRWKKRDLIFHILVENVDQPQIKYEGLGPGLPYYTDHRGHPIEGHAIPTVDPEHIADRARPLYYGAEVSKFITERARLVHDAISQANRALLVGPRRSRGLSPDYN